MKYFIDSEFMEDGKTIAPLSLAIHREDGRGLYLVNADAKRSKANPWVRENVIPQLDDFSHSIPGDVAGPFPLAEFKMQVRLFVSNKPEFWGYYSAYDWVCFCQLFGAMVNLPKGWPMYCRDIKQLCDSLGNPTLPPQGKGEHHALLDARWNAEAYKFLTAL